MRVIALCPIVLVLESPVCRGIIPIPGKFEDFRYCSNEALSPFDYRKKASTERGRYNLIPFSTWYNIPLMGKRLNHTVSCLAILE